VYHGGRFHTGCTKIRELMSSALISEDRSEYTKAKSFFTGFIGPNWVFQDDS
jgi:hypothetical protein